MGYITDPTSACLRAEPVAHQLCQTGGRRKCWLLLLVPPTAAPTRQPSRTADLAGVRANAGRKAKTDRNNALLLVTLLRKKRLPMAYAPPLLMLKSLLFSGDAQGTHWMHPDAGHCREMRDVDS